MAHVPVMTPSRRRKWAWNPIKVKGNSMAKKPKAKKKQKAKRGRK